MKTIYAAVITFIIVCSFLLVASFLYMDRERHKIYFYEISRNGCGIGLVRIDKFRTEERLIYRSSAETPLGIDPVETKESITLNEKGLLESYSEEQLFPKEVASIAIEKKEGGISFVSRFGHDFLYIENMPVSRYPFMFKESSPVTYLPVIDKYDFKDGGPQAFEALTILRPELPPLKRLITLTSITDEYLKVAGRKIKTEKLTLKIRNYPQGSIWVAKSDKAVILIDLPGEGLRISRIFKPNLPKPKPHSYGESGYRIDNIMFKSKGADLAGTVTIPKKEGKFPAVILVWGDGPHDRSYMGLFDSMSDYLTKKGLCVLRFDKRGIGASTGSYLSYSASETMEDIAAAAEYLASREYVDASKITVIGHAEGADPVLRAVSGDTKIRSFALLCPDIFLTEEKRIEKFRRLAPPAGLASRYDAFIDEAVRRTIYKAAGLKGDWAYLLGKRCYLSENRWRTEAKPIMDVVKQIKIPAMLIQGRNDEALYVEYASVIDKALQEGGNSARVLVYYGNLGRFMGRMVNDCVHRAFYEADKDMMNGIANWIGQAA